MAVAPVLRPRVDQQSDHAPTFADSVYAALERKWATILICLALLLVASISFRAAGKPLWHDEIYTWHIARLPSVAAIMQSLAEGLDVAPPLNVLLTRLSHSLLGYEPIATRLPGVLGFLLLCVCLFQIVHRRANLAGALTAMAFPLFTAVYPQSYEARPYGLMLGLSALAVFCWLRAVEVEGRRSMALAGLAIAATAAMWSHFYAVFVFMALAAGEFVRSLQRRRIDNSVWIALVAPLITVPFLIPILRAAFSYSPTSWAPASFSSIGATYTTLLGPASKLIVALAAMWLLFGQRAGRMAGVTRPAPIHEVTASIVLLLLPCFAGLAAVFSGACFTERYVAPTVIGFSLAAGWMVHQASQSRPAFGIIFVLVVGGMFVKLCATPPPRYESVADEHPLLVNASGNEPIVIADGLLFLELWHHARSELASRLYFVNDVGAALEHTGNDSIERNFVVLRRWSDVKIVDYEAFVSAHERFLVYENRDPRWLTARLLQSGARMEVAAREGSYSLLRVDRK